MPRLVRSSVMDPAWLRWACGLTLALGLATTAARAQEEAVSEPAADIAPPASDAVLHVLAWVGATADNGGRPFVVIDKVAAQVFVFDADGLFLGVTPALLGSAPGDDSVPDIGERPLSAIAPEERTTPAGRFVAAFGPAAKSKTVLWVDWATAISLHPVVYANRKERRLDRLVSATPEDNRITYGCINISAAFYEKVVRPLFTDTSGVVYILPEAKPLEVVFPAITAPLGEAVDVSDSPP